ncbi:MAG TPA: hypothetical protein VFH48_44380 [Chloroflexota bacterium]|nr:hypothetical protein [Chloroflexota bacterium]
MALSWRRRNGKLELAQRVAQDRAEALLRDVLTPEEYAGLGERGYLEVRSPSQPTRIYCVPRGPGRVAIQEGGLLVESLCVAPVDWLPPSDVILAHKLMIEGNEQEYLRRANRYRLKVPARLLASGN